MRGWGIVCALALASCVQTDTSTCGSGAVCAAGTVCIDATPAVSVCVASDRARACTDAGLANLASCDVDGRCYAGACVPITCGDLLVDPELEQCDLGDQNAGNGCSADCRSDETCRNGVVDPIARESCDDGNDLALDGCARDCTLEVPQWFEQRRLPARAGSAMAWDGRRQRMILYGGLDNTSPSVLSDTWQWTATGWDRLFEISAPGPLRNHAMTYDAARDRVMVVGGTVVNAPLKNTNTTWLWDGQWSQGPSLPDHLRLSSHAVAYDAAREKVVVFGGVVNIGEVGQNVTSAHAEWNGVGWVELALTTKPPPRQRHGMAYDPIRRKIVLFGGVNLGGLLDDTWVYDEVNGWEQIVVPGPNKRSDVQMAFDGEHVVLYGGVDLVGTPLLETWLWNGSTWTNANDSTPGGRIEAAMATDLSRGTIVLAGFTSSTCEWAGSWTVTDDVDGAQAQIVAAAFDDVTRRVFVVDTGGRTYRQTGRTFDPVSLALAPIGDLTRRMVFDRARRRLVLVGASSGTRVLPEGATSWAPIGGMEPMSQRPPIVVYDVARDRVVLFGGLTNGETWELDGTSWSSVPISDGEAPSPRGNATAAYDPIRQRVVLFGGLDATTGLPLDDTWTWNGDAWTRHATTGPAPRADAAMGWNPSRKVLVLTGGKAGANVFDDVWEWDGAGWTQLAPNGTPPLGRFGHQILPAADGSGAQMFGGRNGVIGFSDLWILRWQGSQAVDTCRSLDDDDGDGLIGCADPDCWAICDPTCSPGIAGCPSVASTCGDGVAAPLETCSFCGGDRGCPTCGNLVCDPGETTGCPGDCP